MKHVKKTAFLAVGIFSSRVSVSHGQTEGASLVSLMLICTWGDF